MLTSSCSIIIAAAIYPVCANTSCSYQPDIDKISSRRCPRSGSSPLLSTSSKASEPQNQACWLTYTTSQHQLCALQSFACDPRSQWRDSKREKTFHLPRNNVLLEKVNLISCSIRPPIKRCLHRYTQVACERCARRFRMLDILPP